MKILLIAGHGDGDSGACGFGYREADLTREVVRNLKGPLQKYADVEIADTNRDMFKYLKSDSYDFTPYDYVLEVHFNAGVSDMTGNGATTGTEIFVNTNESGTAVEENIIGNIAKVGFKSRGVKRENFSVISKIKRQGVSCALLEVCFIDDRDDVDLYQSKKLDIAREIAEGIAVGFGIKTQDVFAPSENEKEELTMSQYTELDARLKKLENAPMIYDYVDDNMPEYARATVKKLMDTGYLKGDENGRLGLDDNLLRMLVINDRAGV
ncbi:MAG: N-acetylmuramoyl-L-alanine amidase, partial [Oscillospiraceae bacterium]